jgi:hypothetical protein
MKEKEIRIMVDDAVALHREIATKTEQLKQIKASLVEQARLNPDSVISTKSGGRRWTAEGSDGCVARVNFPAAALISEIEAESTIEKHIQSVAGDNFRKLFKPVKLYQPVDGFRDRVAALLSAAKAQALLKLCENESAPRVSFETAKQVESAAAE